MKSFRATKRTALALLAGFSITLAVGCENKISKANFDKIQVGMTLAQVQTLLGSSGEEDSAPQGMTISGAAIAGSSKESKEKIYVWKGDDGKIWVTIVDGKVVEAHQTGL